MESFITIRTQLRTYGFPHVIGGKLVIIGGFLSTINERTNKVPYSGKVWQGESLANLANNKAFTKLKPSKLFTRQSIS